MEKYPKQPNMDVSGRVQSPEQSSISTLLNGIGNGWMIGTIPFITAEFYSNITGKKLPKKLHVGSAVMTVASCAIGAYFGSREAKQLHNYRETLHGELSNLDQRLEASESKVDQLTRALEAKEKAEPAR